MTEPRVEAGDRALETARKQAEKWVDDHHPEPIKCIYCDEPQYIGPMASGALWGNCSKAPGKSHTYESTITTGNEREQRIAYLAEFGAVLIQSAMNAQERELREFIADYVDTWKTAHAAFRCARPSTCLVCRGRRLLAERGDTK